MSTSWATGIAYCLSDTGFEAAWEFARTYGVLSRGKALGLDEVECFCVFAYTLGRWESEEGPFRRLNNCLRFPDADPVETEIMGPYAKMLEAAMMKLPVHQGELYRRVDIPADVREQAEKGRFCDLGFLSCSEDASAFPGRDIIAVRSQRLGRSIQLLSRFPNEREVVFPPQSTFMVTGFQTHGQSVTLRLREA